MGKPENDQLAGGLGGPSSVDDESYRDTRLVERAIREQWPIPEHFRKPLIDRQIRIAIDPEASFREATSAFKAILSANAQNMEQEARDNPQAVEHHHTGNIGLVALRQELLDDSDLIEFRRRQALECDVDAGAVCEVRQPGEVEGATAHHSTRPGANGHSNGKK